MKYEMTGTITELMDTQTFQSGFQKREFVITNEDKYPQTVKFEVVKDKIELLSAYKLTDRVTVSFNIRGNEHNGRYYVNLIAWKIEKAVDGAPAQAPVGATQGASDGDEIPF